MTSGWTKISGACDYADVEKRTIRNWLHSGLKHSRLPTGRILIRYQHIDEFLEKYATTEETEAAKLDQLATKIVRELKS